MAKAEQSPPFKMKIENGHLVPAAAWDAERLASYRNGSEVNCVITQEVASWRRRKYWSILGKVVKTCPVRQKRAEDLHKAIRLKLGIVESFTTMSGATKVELRSTSLMDEQEFEAYYHEAMDLLRDATGVDVETLHKEAPDVGRDETEQPEDQTPPPPASGSGSSGAEIGSDTTSPAAADQSAGAADHGEEGASETADGQTVAPSSPTLSDEDRQWLVKAARMLIPSAAPNGDPNVVRRQYSALIKTETPTSVSQLAIGKAVAISKRLVAVCECTEDLDLELLAGIAGCDVREIRP